MHRKARISRAARDRSRLRGDPAMPGPSARARVRLTPPLAGHKDPESAKSRRPEGPQDLTKRLSHVAQSAVKSEVNARHSAADVLMKRP